MPWLGVASAFVPGYGDDVGGDRVPDVDHEQQLGGGVQLLQEGRLLGGGGHAANLGVRAAGTRLKFRRPGELWTAPAAHAGSPLRVTMDTIALHSVNPWEVSFLREEVGGYFAHGVELAPGATVLDVGANVGVFSAAVYERLDGDVRIFAFEPLPPLYETLARNGRDFFDGRLSALPFGLAAAEDELDFSYFPGATIFSSSLRDAGNIEAEKKRVTASIVEMIRQGSPAARRLPGAGAAWHRRPQAAGDAGPRDAPGPRRPLSPVLDEQRGRPDRPAQGRRRRAPSSTCCGASKTGTGRWCARPSSRLKAGSEPRPRPRGVHDARFTVEASRTRSSGPPTSGWCSPSGDGVLRLTGWCGRRR